MRNAFIQELVALARVDPAIVLMVGDLGYSVIEPFVDEFPDRFINAGVAEQNMMGLAAGMVSEGCHVFAYSIANFPTFRCAEQIRNDVAYQNLPVTVVSVGGGLSYGSLGYSHHAVQDYALIRSFPGMLIAAPGDPMETRACMQYLAANPQPSYLRLGKAGEPTFHERCPGIAPGQWVRVRGRPDARKALLCTGSTLQLAQAVVDALGGEDVCIHSLPLWGMGVKAAQAAQVAAYDRVLTLEDHLVDGGFGSWLMESMGRDLALRQRIDVAALDPIVCGAVGAQATLNRLGGLDVEDLAQRLR